MIELEFKKDERKLREDIEVGFPEEIEAALFETYFELPVRFSINGVELFERISLNINRINISETVGGDIRKYIRPISTPWLELPILNVATTCFDMIRKAWEGEKAVYSIPGGAGYLVFKKTNSKIRVLSTINDRVADADCLELKNAFTIFSNRAQELAEDLFPQLKTDELWNKLFK
jgi:hypothetical protein